MNEEGDVINLRNYIDHFKYYTATDRSMMDLYSEVFDRFFVYDMKYAKNVPNMMYNILLSHFITAEFGFDSGVKSVRKEVKSSARLDFRKIRSEMLTYKIDDNQTLKVPARGRRFIEDVIRLLHYSTMDEEYMVPDKLVEIGKIKVEKKKGKPSNKPRKYNPSYDRKRGNKQNRGYKK